MVMRRIFYAAVMTLGVLVSKEVAACSFMPGAKLDAERVPKMLSESDLAVVVFLLGDYGSAGDAVVQFDARVERVWKGDVAPGDIIPIAARAMLTSCDEPIRARTRMVLFLKKDSYGYRLDNSTGQPNFRATQAPKYAQTIEALDRLTKTRR